MQAVGSKGLQQVLLDGPVAEAPGQLDLLAGAMQVNDVDGDGASDVALTAGGRGNTHTSFCYQTLHTN